jgi:hypothetical protein
MEQMMECLVAATEKMDAKIDTNQGKVMAKLDAYHKMMMARMGS